MFCLILYFEGFEVFVGVGIVPVVFFVDKSKPSAKTMKIVHTGSFEDISSMTLIKQDSPFLFKKTTGDILDFSYENTEKLGDICFISVGMVLNADEKKS